MNKCLIELDGTCLTGVLVARGIKSCEGGSFSFKAIYFDGDERSSSLLRFFGKNAVIFSSTSCSCFRILSLFSKTLRQDLHMYVTSVSTKLDENSHFQLVGRLLKSLDALFMVHSFLWIISLDPCVVTFEHKMQIGSLCISPVSNFTADILDFILNYLDHNMRVNFCIIIDEPIRRDS